MIITEWAKQYPLLAGGSIILFFIFVFSLIALFILTLSYWTKLFGKLPKGLSLKPQAQKPKKRKKPRKEKILYIEPIDQFKSSALNMSIAMSAPYSVVSKQAVDSIDMEPTAFFHDWNITSKNALLNHLEQLRVSGSRRNYGSIINAVLEHDDATILKLIARISDETDKKMLMYVYRHRAAYEGASLLIWDIMRAVMLIRSGAHPMIGYLTVGEAKEYLLQITEPLHRISDNWKDVAKGFLAGRQLWQMRQGEDVIFQQELDKVKEAIGLLLTDKSSPWLKQKWLSQWPREMLRAPLFSMGEFDIILERYFFYDGILHQDLVQAFERMVEEESLKNIACFINSFRYGLHYLTRGPLREISQILELSQPNQRGFATAIMLGGMHLLSALEEDIDDTMSQIAGHIFRVEGHSLISYGRYIELEKAVQNQAINIFDVAMEKKENLWGMLMTLEELQAARIRGEASYNESLGWEDLPLFSGWLEQEL